MKRANFVDFFGTICPILNLHRCKTKIDGIITNYPDILNDIKMCNIV